MQKEKDNIINPQIRRIGIDWSWSYALAALWVTTLLFFWPVIKLFPESVIPAYFPDALEFIWTTWRLEGVLTGIKQLYSSQDIYAPDGASLLLHTISEGILLPVTSIFSNANPVWRFNISIILIFLANSAAALSLFRALGCTALPAAMCSLLVTFAPFAVGHVAAGHINLLALFPLLEALRGILIFSSPSRTPDRVVSLDGIRYLTAISFLILTNLYYLYFAALVCGLIAFYQIALCREHTRAAVKAAGLFIAGLIPLSPHLVAIARLALSNTYTPDHNPELHSADLAAYLAPSTLQFASGFPWARSLRAGILLHEVESSLYFGFSLLALGLLSCFQLERHLRKRSRMFLLGSGLFGIMSLGPHVKWMSTVLYMNPVDALLRTILPLYPSVPVRFGIIAILLLVAAGSLCASTLNPKRIRAVGLLLLGCAIIENAPKPLQAYPLRHSSSVLETLALELDAGIVLDFSQTPQFSMLRQTIHHKPIIGGYLSRRPKKAEVALRRNPFLRMLRGSKARETPQILEGWCALGATRLLLEQPVIPDTESRLAALGFMRKDSDDWVVLFTPPAEVCSSANATP